jgi:CBS domain-containing protein
MMIENQLDTLLVIEGGQLLGVIGLRDLFTAPVVAYPGVSMRRYDSPTQLEEVWKSNPVQSSMNQNVMSIDEETSILRAAELMANYGKHLLPVLSAGQVVGTISRTDIVRAILTQGKDLSDIYRPDGDNERK